MSTPVKIAIAITASATDLYVPGANVPGEVAVLDLCNTTTADVTVDVWYAPNGGGTLVYLFDDVVVPAKGHVQWTGLLTLDTNGDKLRAQGSATGVDCLGTAKY